MLHWWHHWHRKDEGTFHIEGWGYVQSWVRLECAICGKRKVKLYAL